MSIFGSFYFSATKENVFLLHCIIKVVNNRNTVLPTIIGALSIFAQSLQSLQKQMSLVFLLNCFYCLLFLIWFSMEENGSGDSIYYLCANNVGQDGLSCIAYNTFTFKQLINSLL